MKCIICNDKYIITVFHIELFKKSKWIHQYNENCPMGCAKGKTYKELFPQELERL